MEGPDHIADIFAGDGEMAERCAAFPWEGTPLGPVTGWTASLRTTVATMLRSRFPMCLSWGPRLVLLYNDAFVPTLGAKHPDALGREIETVFPEIWDEVGYLQFSVLEGGEPVFAEELPLVLERGSGPEETFYTFCYSQVPDLGGPGPGGVLATVTETTRAVVGTRRMRMLNALASATTDARDQATAVRATLDTLAVADGDLRHGACYLPRSGTGDLGLAGSFGPGPVWPATLTPDRAGVVDVPDDGTTRQVVLPVRTGSGEAGDSGVLVVAPNPLRPLDVDHEDFLHLLADHVGQVLTLAAARADEQRRLEALAAADLAKSTFLSQVSHEFRTPLTLLLGPLEDALEPGGGPLSPTDLTAMHHSAYRLLRMVNALLEVSRMDAAPRVAAREPTDVVRLTDDLLAPFRGAAARTGLTRTTDLDHRLGLVDLDPALWDTLLVNLVANALKYTLQGSIHVVLGAEDDDLVLVVRDTGIGIPDADHERVFDRFHRVAGPVGRTIEGTGLGLALVRDAVTAHGGRVDLASTTGVGSTFTVRIPRSGAVAEGRDDGVPSPLGEPLLAAAVLAEQVVPAGAAVSPSSHDGPEDPDAPVIIVVDDNPGMRHRLARLLGEVGRVVTCADGVEALDVLRHQPLGRPVDLLVTDVMMPRLDGVGLLREVRADPRLAGVPVLLLSARAGTEAAAEALELGADDYVVKPFTRQELVARCRTTIELAAARTRQTAETARTTMLAGISHDMQTPLSVITAALDMLRDPDGDPARQAETLGRASVRAAQLEHLLSQFLDWSRLAAGAQLQPRADVVPLAEVVTEVGLEVEGVTLAPGIADTDVAVVGDRHRIERILRNLLANASAAARTGVRVEVVEAPTSPGQPEVVEVHVVDDGAGVPADVLPHLFTAFGPTGRRSASAAGSGLGLHVSRASARAQGGDVVLAATDGTGSRFVLRLPRHRPEGE